MKNIYLLSLALLVLSCNQKKDNLNDAVIKLTVLNSDFSKVYLVGEVDDSFDTLAEIELLEETVEIPYNIKYPELLYLNFDGYNKPLQVFADADGMEVTLDFGVNPPDRKITGSIQNESLEAYYEIEDNFNASMQSYQSLRMQAQNDQVIAEILKKKEDSTYAHFKRSTLDFCYTNDLVGAFIANRRIYDLNYAQADSVYQNIQAKFAGAGEVVALKEKRAVLKKLRVGEPFIDINQPNFGGDLLSLDEVVKENTYTLIYFWASWHQASRLSNVRMVKTYNSFKSKGFEIYAISLDEKMQDWSNAVEQDSTQWIQVSSLKGIENEAAKAYGIYFLPQSILINKYGIIEVKNLSDDDLNEYLTEKL